MKSTFPNVLIAILLATLLFSCAPASDEAVEDASQQELSNHSEGETPDDNVVHVTINSDGTCVPEQISVERGDRVVFHANDLAAGVCIDRGEVFGATHYGIPKGNELQLIVQDFAPLDAFTYTVNYGDPNQPCPGSFGGGGTVTGGPG